MGTEFPPWIATNWGSDIFLFGKLPEHREKISRILNYADYYSAECHRDVKIARESGFHGPGAAGTSRCGRLRLGANAEIHR